MKRIKISTSHSDFEAQLHETPTAALIWDTLPMEATCNTWGNEIYFGSTVHTSLEPGAKAEVEAGDLAYWPDMPAFCIFFGPTPMSINDKPKAAGPVNVFGKLVNVDIKALQSVISNEKIRVERLG